MKTRDLFLLLLCSFWALQCQQNSPKPNAHLGTVHIEVSGKAEALPLFEEGLLLLHSFEYEDAAEKFAEARNLDPDFAMAYWGEAMTKNHPLWSQQNTEEARAILEELAPSPEERQAKVKTELERALFHGAEILYGDGEKLERDDKYADYLAQLYQKYPGNHEIASWYALSLLGSVEEGRDYEVYGKGAVIAKGILEENPQHPGALHYLIHSYDDPEHAQLALAAANNYSKVAPDAGHALHMPSHIYIAMGMWEEVIQSNIASWEASKARAKRKGDSPESGYHAFKWLMYGYLQKGDLDKAKTMVEEMKQYCDANPSSRARAHWVMMRGAYLSESNRWDEPMALDTVDQEDLSINVRTAIKFTEGMVQYHKQDIAGLQKVIGKLVEMRKATKNVAFTQGAKMCSGGSYKGLPTQLDLDQTEVVELELRALLAMLQQEDNKVVEYLDKATVLEKNTSFNFGPPVIIKPSGELYAEWLMTKDKKEEAKLHLNDVLSRAPKRLITTQHLAAL